MKANSKALVGLASESYQRVEVLQAVAQLDHDYTTDTYIEILVDEILSSRTGKNERARSLARLLSVYGVGTIVTGRLN